MQTNFTLAQLADADTRESETILRKCVHCGFCTATCPTYVLLGDELDSPRGRIYLIKDMLENDRPASEKVVKHIDRCLSCLSCMTTCPSGVHYGHLVDHARSHIEETYRRPLLDRGLRWVLSLIVPYPARFRASLLGARLGKPLARILPGRLGAMIRIAPSRLPAPSPLDTPQVIPAQGPRRARVTTLIGCAQRVLNTAINEATIRLLTRHGVEVVIARGSGCCGALVHHMGKSKPAHEQARRNIDAWWPETAAGGGDGLDAIVINASGCGTTVKDYGFMFREDAEIRDRAAAISDLTVDITEFMERIGLASPVIETGHKVSYHSACSMQHGQQIKAPPKNLLNAAGFRVREPAEGHLCCGSAGVYNLLQPEIATRLRDRKLANIDRTEPEIIATGNIGCMTQLAAGTDTPIVHTAELLDWATGGPKPARLSDFADPQPLIAAAAAPETRQNVA